MPGSLFLRVTRIGMKTNLQNGPFSVVSLAAAQSIAMKFILHVL